MKGKYNMKLIDKFLKKLNVSRNTFATFILTLVTIYIAVDRIVEMLLMIFTGVASSYWGPIAYTFALACPVFAYMFSGTSSFSETRAEKVTMFYAFAIGFYIIVLSMFTQHINMIGWLLFISAPSYVTIVSDFSELIAPAFRAISLYLPLTTVYPFVKLILIKIDDTQTSQRSLWDYKGISLAPKDLKGKAYQCNLKLFKDFDDSSQVSFPEVKRYKSLLVCGGSGSGKTSMVFEPSIAQDIEKKQFFREASKELGFTALKTGIANLSAPYSNEYLNKNFSLNMLTPSYGKDTLFNTFVKRMVLSSSPHNVYKDIGITYLSPDYETISNMMKVCDNYSVGYSLVDPSQPALSKGLNPFIYDNPNKIAVIISSAIHGVAPTEFGEEKDAYREETSLQILENLAILLKVMYPRMNNGSLPNLEDLLTLLSNFSLVEKMCKIMEHDEELAEQYKMELSYFKRTFYADGKGKSETEQNAYYISSRLENLLRAPNIRSILCDRHNNINFDNALQNGEVIFVCTRRGESGSVAHKAFGLFFLLSMQNAVLSRPGNENSRIPHFLYIDEFPNFLTRDTESMFTSFRKYKVALAISIQSISQLTIGRQTNLYNSTILANCSSKVTTGGATSKAELEWWETELSQWKQWKYTRNYEINADDPMASSMSKTFGNPEYKYTPKVNWSRVQNLKQNQCGYRIEQSNGSWKHGVGIMRFMSAKYKEKHPGKEYDFEKFSNNATSSNNDNDGNGTSLGKKLVYDEYGEFNPVQNQPTKYKFDDENIVIDLKNESNN